MRPVALFSGVGAGSAMQWQTGGLPFWFSIAGGLIAGLIAFWLSGVLVKRTTAQTSEAALMALYVTSFSCILIAALSGCWLGAWVAPLG
jgi:hypothetical protein